MRIFPSGRPSRMLSPAEPEQQALEPVSVSLSVPLPVLWVIPQTAGTPMAPWFTAHHVSLAYCSLVSASWSSRLPGLEPDSRSSAPGVGRHRRPPWGIYLGTSHQSDYANKFDILRYSTVRFSQPTERQRGGRWKPVLKNRPCRIQAILEHTRCPSIPKRRSRTDSAF
jgi:hypothetical protein